MSDEGKAGAPEDRVRKALSDYATLARIYGRREATDGMLLDGLYDLQLVVAERDRLRELLRAIVLRGGPGHWTWRLADDALGAGTAERWHASRDVAGEVREALASIDRTLAKPWFVAELSPAEDEAPRCEVCREHEADTSLTRRGFVCSPKCLREREADEGYERWKARRKP